MKVYAIIALVLCATVVSAQSNLVQTLTAQLCPSALANAQAQFDNAHPLLKPHWEKILKQIQTACAQRGIFDSLANVLGLGGVWDTISSLPASLFSQFTQIMDQIIFSGKFLWDNHLKDMLAQLANDLKGHAMDAIPIVQSYIPKLLAVLASSAGKRDLSLIAPELQRGIFDSIYDMLGLGTIWSNITSVASDLKDQFIKVLTTLMLAGGQAWAQTKDIIADLTKDLVGHAGNASPLLQAAIAKLKDVAAQAAIGAITGKRDLEMQRGFWDTIVSVTGLGSVWSTIQGVSKDLYAKFMLTVEKLLFAGTTAWQNAIPIFSDLKNDLIAHAGNASPLIGAAIDKLSALLPSAGKRATKRDAYDDLLDYLDNSVLIGGLLNHPDLFAYLKYIADLNMVDPLAHYTEFMDFIDSVNEQIMNYLIDCSLDPECVLDMDIIYDIIYGAGNDLIILMGGTTTPTTTKGNPTQAQTTTTPDPGKRSLAEERGILEFAENLFGISGIISTVTALGSNIKNQFLDLVKQVFMHGTNAWALAKPIFAQLVSDLTGHASNAGPIVTGAIAQLKEMLAGIAANHLGKREVVQSRAFADYLESFFGLGAIVQNIQSLAGDLKAKFFLVLEQLLFSGKNAWELAKPIFADLVAKLKGHAELAVPLFTEAINKLTGIVGNHFGKRELIESRGFLDYIWELFGIEGIISTVSSLASGIKDKFFDTVKAVFFAGSSAWAAAVPIFNDLKNELIGHTSNAGPIVQVAIDRLKQMLIEVAANHVGKRGLFDSLTEQFTGAVQTVQTVLSLVHGELKNKLAAALIAASAAKDQALVILRELLAELKSHATNADVYIKDAIAKLLALAPANIGKRGIFDAIDNIVNIFKSLVGKIPANFVSDIFSLLTHLTGQFQPLLDQLTGVLAQVAFAKDKIKEQVAQFLEDAFQQLSSANWSNIPSVIGELIAKIKNQLGGLGKRGIFDSITQQFGSALSTVQTVLSLVHGELKNKLALALIAASAAKDQALVILGELLAELKSHASNADVYIKDAIAKLLALAPANLGKRATLGDVFDIVQNVFNNYLPANIVQEILAIAQHASGLVKDKLMTVLALLPFAKDFIKQQAGKLLDQAFQVLNNSNWANAQQIIQNVIDQISNLLKQ